MDLRTRVRRAIRRAGYDVHRLHGEYGEGPFDDLKRVLEPGPGPICLDVGANAGQTVAELRSNFDRPVIHSFEPDPRAFSELERATAGLPDVHVHHCAVGARAGRLELIEREPTVMSSMLEPGEEPMGDVRGRVEVEARTVDDHCRTHGIDRIDLLKSDTQGYDLEVLRGAAGMFDSGAVHAVMVEVNFHRHYDGLPRPDELCSFLFEGGMRAVAFYNVHYSPRGLSWFDALFAR